MLMISSDRGFPFKPPDFITCDNIMMRRIIKENEKRKQLHVAQKVDFFKTWESLGDA